MDIKKEIYTTAELLNIVINEEELKKLEDSFSMLLEYFSIMQKAVHLEMSKNNALTPHINFEMGHVGIGRDDIVSNFLETASLIERSETHEDNYICIPRVL